MFNATVDNWLPVAMETLKKAYCYYIPDFSNSFFLWILNLSWFHLDDFIEEIDSRGYCAISAFKEGAQFACFLYISESVFLA